MLTLLIPSLASTAMVGRPTLAIALPHVIEPKANSLQGMVPYEVALTAVFVEGFVFVGLTMLGIRQWLAR
jgi:xanthine/uracil/vitamin C permease (AzgA family)